MFSPWNSSFSMSDSERHNEPFIVNSKSCLSSLPLNPEPKIFLSYSLLHGTKSSGISLYDEPPDVKSCCNIVAYTLT